MNWPDCGIGGLENRTMGYKRPVMFVCQIVELVDLSVKISGNQINDKEV